MPRRRKKRRKSAASRAGKLLAKKRWQPDKKRATKRSARQFNVIPFRRMRMG